MQVVAKITRDLLQNMPELNINDHENYTLSATILGGSVTYQTKWASSDFVDGDIPLRRRKANTIEKFDIWVMGSNTEELYINLKALIDGFTQDHFSLLLQINNATSQYECYAADYTVNWTREGLHANKLLVNLQVPRNPIATQGI